MEEFIKSWGYLGVFLGIVATGLGLPVPEELPVVLGGMAVGSGHAIWYVMLPVCVLGVVIGDSFLYGIGWFCGAWLVEKPFVKKHLLTPERLQQIRDNFNSHGVKILLFARMTPGIRAPVFLTAGITRLPLYQFLLADGLYAIPGVSVLFTLGWAFGDSVVNVIQSGQWHRIVILVVLVGVAGYFLYWFLRRPMVVGDPKDVPPLAQPMQHTLEQISKMVHVNEKPAPPPPTDASAGRAPQGENRAAADGQGASSQAQAQSPHKQQKTASSPSGHD